MTELLTAAQMRAIEQAAIASGEVTGLELMERAGRGVVEAIFEEWPELKAGSFRAVVLCGPGNNGGDGFVVARLLKEWGWEVAVFLYGAPEKLPPDARVNYERWCGMGEVSELTDEAAYRASARSGIEDGVLVDALFGTGLTRSLSDDVLLPLSTFLSIVPLCFLKHVAVDMPSGVCSDSGRTLMNARGVGNQTGYNLVVTFHRARVGHHLGDLYYGRVRVKDIGLPKAGTMSAQQMHSGILALAELAEFARSGGNVREMIDFETEKSAAKEHARAKAAISHLVDGFDAYVDKAEHGRAHKYTHGHALILSGGAGKGGAARLAARGALRIGAGLVTLGCPPEALAENAARLDAVMLKPVADADAFAPVLEDKRIIALCLGPGLGTGDREVALVAAALAAKRALVLDADALTILACEPGLFAALHENCVLTPHAGEFARLFPDIAEKLAAPATKGPAYSKVDACREAAKRAGCVVLFKGPDTVIADPDGRCSINSAHYERAAPWLATAGSGDVLAGFITGLLARGFSPMQAAETAAWLHVECARAFGPGLIAEDLPEQLPSVFRDLGL
ncbi:MAG: NAD(P)H-hydrate dehydratase [Albidovulum sp.]